MTTFAQKRCFVHSLREAVCLCTECRHSFCRECATDYDGRLVCTACVVKLRRPAQTGRGYVTAISTSLSIATALLVAWVFFYMAGRVFLLAEPAHHTFTRTNAP